VGCQSREVVVPKEQLTLTEPELDEEITKMLTANNPGAPTNLARYNHKVRPAARERAGICVLGGGGGGEAAAQRKHGGQ
jgi:hypothetical protein